MEPVILLWKPTTERLNAVLEEASSASLTYPEVGATGRDELPAGYRHVHREISLGRGGSVYQKAVDGLFAFQAQQRAGLRVTTNNDQAEPDTVLVATFPLGPAALALPTRVVSVTREDTQAGFVYGTLPGHPVRGEEAFFVERNGDDVLLTITAFSRAAGWLEWLGTPVSRVVQSRTTEGYLRGLQSFVEQPRG